MSKGNNIAYIVSNHAKEVAQLYRQFAIMDEVTEQSLAKAIREKGRIFTNELLKKLPAMCTKCSGTANYEGENDWTSPSKILGANKNVFYGILIVVIMFIAYKIAVKK